jgi:hypothetical protein
MKRTIIGTYPYEMTREDGLTVLRFFPKKPDAKFPDDPVLVLKLSQKDKRTLIGLLS